MRSGGRGAPPRASRIALALTLALGAAAGPAGATSQAPQLAADEPRLPPATPRVGPVQRAPDGTIHRIDPTAKPGKGPRRCDPHTLCVGADQAFPSLGAALAAASTGDVVEVTSGIYRESVKIIVAKVTIRGVGGVPHFDCTGLGLVDGKACLLLAADEVTLEGLEISGAVLGEDRGANGACIRNEPNLSYTVRRVLCHGSQDGILSDGGKILIEGSEFFDNGWTGQTHNVYFSGNCVVTVRGSIFRDARIGHEFKSRCRKTEISDSTFKSTRGSRNLDISEGGETLVYRSTLTKALNTDNAELVAFAPESCSHPGDMTLKDVRIVNADPRAAIHNYDRCAGHPIVLQNVTVEGTPVREIGYVVTR